MTVQHILYTQWWKKNNTTMKKYFETKSKGLLGVLSTKCTVVMAGFCFSSCYYFVDYTLMRLVVTFPLPVFVIFPPFFCGHFPPSCFFAILPEFS